MGTEEKQGVAVLERYFTSLADLNQSWRPDEENKKTCDTFSDCFESKYLPTVHPKVLRSSDSEFDGSTLPELNPTVDIHWSPGFGRYLVAARDIIAGEVVFRETPLVVGPKAGSGATCLACLKALPEDKWEGCENCGAPMCRPDCFGEGHSKDECEVLASLRLKEQPRNGTLIKQLNVLLTPLRVFLLMDRNPSAKDIIGALQSHEEERRDLPIGRFVDQQVVPMLRERLGISAEVQDIRRVCGICDTNSYQVSDGEARVGRALFVVASLMNHCCTPNTQHWFRDGVMTVRAVVDIPEGAPVTNAYTNTLWGTRARAAHLLTSKLFVCKCERCLDPAELGSHISSVKCRECQRGLLLPPSETISSWQCQSCGSSVPSSTIDTLLRVGGIALGRLKQRDVQGITSVHQHLSQILGDTHFTVVEVKLALIHAILGQPIAEVSQTDLERVLDLTSNLLHLAEQLEPGLTRIKGVLRLERTRAIAELLCRRNMNENKILDLLSCNSSSTLIQKLHRELVQCENILQYDVRLSDVREVSRRLKALHGNM